VTSPTEKILSQSSVEFVQDYHFMLFMQPKHKTAPPASGAGPSLVYPQQSPALLVGTGAGAQQKRALGVLALGQQSAAVGPADGAGIRAPLWL
jgi:hypothetical protein